MFSEILADPNSGGDNFDTDGDGTAETQDEFVEFFNLSSSDIDISGWEFWDEDTDGAIYTFPSNTILKAGAYVVVVSDIVDGSLPAVTGDNLAFSTGGVVSFSNGGDNFALVNPVSDEFVQAKYNGDSDFDFFSLASFSTTASLIGTVEDFGNDSDGNSIVRTPADGTGFDLNKNACSCSDLASPGAPTVVTTSGILTWDGSESSVWNVAGNWDGDAVPTSANDIVIPDVSQGSRNNPIIDASLAVEIGDLTIETGGLLTVESGGALIISGSSTVDGQFEIERNIAGNFGYSIVGSTTATTFSDLDAAFVFGYVGNEYTTNLNESGATMSPGAGYFVAYDPSTVNSSGSASYFFESFDSDLGMFTAQSVVGDQVWGNGSFSGIFYASMSGFANSMDNANEDWLVSPALDLTSITDPKLTFDVAVGFLDNADVLTIQVSTDYVDDVTNATWAELTLDSDFPTSSSGFSSYSTYTADLSAYTSEAALYIAFAYDNTSTSPIDGGTYQIDYFDISGTVPVLTFAGTPETGAVSVPVTAGNFELVANPYTSAISRDDFLTANLDDTDGVLYFWDDGGSNVGSARGGDFIVYTNSGMMVSTNDLSDGVSGLQGEDAAGSGYIASMQGFFVNAISNSGDGAVDFAPSMQTLDVGANDDANHYRVTNTERVKLSLYSDNTYNEILVARGADFTLGRDYGADALKLKGTTGLSFYSLEGSAEYAIQALPTTSSKVQLGVDLAEAGQYKLGVVAMENIPDDLVVRLKDKVTGRIYELNEETVIDFTSGITINNQRFELSFGKAGVLANEDKLSDIKVFGNLSGLNVEFQAEGLREVAVYDLSGKVVFQDLIEFESNQSRLNPKLELDKLYILKIEDQSIKFLLK